MHPGDRVKLTEQFIRESTAPERFALKRGVILEPTPHILKIGPEYILVLWDGIPDAYPVLVKYLEIDR